MSSLASSVTRQGLWEAAKACPRRNASSAYRDIPRFANVTVICVPCVVVTKATVLSQAGKARE